MNYQHGAKYLDNLFSYFNRVSLRKYQTSESIDYALPGIYNPQPTPLPQNTPVEIRNVRNVSPLTQTTTRICTHLHTQHTHPHTYTHTHTDGTACMEVCDGGESEGLSVEGNASRSQKVG